jgi:PAS domain S-box-containing protein
MFSKSLRIPIGFLTTGLLWALLSDPVITFFFGGINIHIRDIIRSANDFLFVGFASVALFFKIKHQQRQLLSSEKQYRRLFELNPNPMWVFNSESLQFVEVNRSTLELYGYSNDEFLSMTILDIRPEEDRQKMVNMIRTHGQGVRLAGTWRHLKKNGELLYMSIVSYDIEFNKKPCTLVMANDVTSLVLKEGRIKDQNAALHEIAWLNSHEIRKSLCSVMSLTALLKDTASETERRQYILMIEQCTNELDDVLRKTNSRVDELKVYDKKDHEPAY